MYKYICRCIYKYVYRCIYKYLSIHVYIHICVYINNRREREADKAPCEGKRFLTLHSKMTVNRHISTSSDEKKAEETGHTYLETKQQKETP